MALDRTSLFESVRSYLNRPNLTDTELNTVLNVVQGELNRILLMHPRNRITANYTMQPNDENRIPLPEDMGAMIQLSNFTQDRQEYHQTSLRGGYDLRQDDWAWCYFDRGSYLELNPVPAEGDFIQMDYHALLPDLDEGPSTNWITTYYPDLYIYGMLKEFSIFLKHDQRLTLWRSEFDRRVGDLQRQGWNQNIEAGFKMSVRDE